MITELRYVGSTAPTYLKNVIDSEKKIKNWKILEKSDNGKNHKIVFSFTTVALLIIISSSINGKGKHWKRQPCIQYIRQILLINWRIGMEDLYAGIDLHVPPAVLCNEKYTKRKLAPNHPKSLTDQVEELQEAVKRLESENKRLRRNIGTLFRTATSELTRKDRQLEEIRRT